MNSVNYYIFNFLVLLLHPFSGKAQDNEFYQSPIQDRIVQVENSLAPVVRFEKSPLWNLEERMKFYNIPGLSIAVIDNYKIDWAKGYGWADNIEKIPVTTETVFRAGSVSKSINAVGILRLAEEGKLDLYEDINNLLGPWKFPYNKMENAKPINTYHLLSHTAGLPEHGVKKYKNAKTALTAAEILKQRNNYVQTEFDPGLRFAYSSGGITITQLILEEVTQLSYNTYMQENVLKPLDMANSFYVIPADKSSIKFANAHSPNGKQLKNQNWVLPEIAASGLWTTPTDLCKFIIELQLSLKGKSHRLLSKDYTELMLTPAVQKQAHDLGTFINALGFFIEDQHGEKYFKHGGAIVMFQSQFYASFEGGKGVVIMMNTWNGPIVSEIIASVASVYQWKNFLFNEGNSIDQIFIDEQKLKDYEGNYTNLSDPSHVIKIKAQGEGLHFEEKWKSGLIPISQSMFFIRDITPNTTLEFLRDNSGKVTSLQINQNGLYQWEKVK